MIQEDLKKFEEILLKRKTELEEELKGIPLVTDMGSDVEGQAFDEEADEAEEMTTNYALRKSLKEELRSINEALEKIKNGVYGKCEKCSNAIEKEFLNIKAGSRICKNCEPSNFL